MIKAEQGITSSNDCLSPELVLPVETAGSISLSTVVTLSTVSGNEPGRTGSTQDDPTYATSVAHARVLARSERSAAPYVNSVVPSLPATARFPDLISNSLLRIRSQDQMPGTADEQEHWWQVRQNRLDAIALARKFPQPTTVAARWLHQRITDLYGQDIDSDVTYLHRFKDCSMESHTQGVPEATHTLSEVAAFGGAGIKGWKSRDVAELNAKFGLYTERGPTASYDVRKQVRLQASEFRDLLKTYDGNQEYGHAVRMFWDKYKDDYRRLVADSFAIAAVRQYSDGKLSEQGFKLLDGPVFSFDLAGNRAADMLRFKSADSKRVVLYIPGQQYPFHEFKSEGKLRQWVVALASDKEGRDQLGSHFSNAQREVYGVDNFLLMLARVPAEQKKINQIDRIGTSEITHDFLARIALWGIDQSLQDAQTGILQGHAGNIRQQAVSVLSPLLGAPDRQTADVAMQVLASPVMAQEFDVFLQNGSAKGLHKNRLNAVLGAFAVPQAEDPAQLRRRLERISERMARLDPVYQRMAQALQTAFKPDSGETSIRAVRAARWTLKQAEALQQAGIPAYRQISQQAWAEAIHQRVLAGTSAGKLNVQILAGHAQLLDRIPERLWERATNAT